MPRDYNINISIGSGDSRGSFSGGNVYKTKSTLNSKNKIDNGGESHTTNNLKRVFTIGLAFNIAQKANEIRGAYTRDRIKQKRFETGMTFAKYGIGIAINPLVGGVYAVGDLAYRGIMYGIDIDTKNREADYYKRLSGNNSNSGSRYRGGYL